MRGCEWCAYKETEWLLYQSLHWSVYLADRQDYVGRCILVLNRHCGSLSELDVPEWMELKTIINRLEWIYKEVLGAELCNWSCLLNNFYKEAVPNPHLHIHVRPRYKNAVVINNHTYIDTEFTHHYALKKESIVLDDDRKVLYALMNQTKLGEKLFVRTFRMDARLPALRLSTAYPDPLVPTGYAHIAKNAKTMMRRSLRWR